MRLPRNWDGSIDWSFILIPAIAVAFVGAIVWALLHDSGRRYYSVPAEVCTAKYTGRTREEFVGNQCVSYDSKMNCTVWMPQYETQHEQEVTCQTFAVWK